MAAEETSTLQLELSKAAKKRCKGVTRNGAACTAWDMQSGVTDTTAPKNLLTNLNYCDTIIMNRISELRTVNSPGNNLSM